MDGSNGFRHMAWRVQFMIANGRIAADWHGGHEWYGILSFPFVSFLSGGLERRAIIDHAQLH
jgi:hypothetical protein